ncbi:MAG: response regulator transcription factor [Acinetobacter sp.]
MTNSNLIQIVVIDDEPQIRKFLGIALKAQGYTVQLCDNAGNGLQFLASQQADLVILDLGLPDMDGQQVLKELRTWSNVPVIILSVRSSEQEKVTLLDAGANDYVTKPFSVQELMARIRVILRHHSANTEMKTFKYRELEVDFIQHRCMVAGEIVVLTRKEFQLLTLLIQHQGQILTQPQILKTLWGPTHQEDTHYLRILVAKLRNKLNDDAIHPKYIYTEPGVGLRFLL